MGENGAVLVEKVLGSKLSGDGKSMTIGLVSDGSEFKLDCSPTILTILALTALNAKSILDDKAHEEKSVEAGSLHSFPCDGWEIRKAADGTYLLLSFRVTGGAWVRVQIPSAAARPIRETLESVEGRAEMPAIRGRVN